MLDILAVVPASSSDSLDVIHAHKAASSAVVSHQVVIERVVQVSAPPVLPVVALLAVPKAAYLHDR